MRKYIFAICVGIVVMCLCVGCNKEKKKAGTVDLPELVIGSDNYEPYYYINEQGKTVGIDVELAQEACRRIGYKPVFKKIIWDNKDSELEAGNIDCIWGSYTMTGRENEYQWAGPYMYSHQVIVVSAESNIKTIDELKDLIDVYDEIVAKAGSISDGWNFTPERIDYDNKTNLLTVYGEEYCRGESYHESYSFPMEWMFMSPDQIKDAKIERKRLEELARKKREEELAERKAREQEERDKAEYERLKQKFEKEVG